MIVQAREGYRPFAPARCDDLVASVRKYDIHCILGPDWQIPRYFQFIMSRSYLIPPFPTPLNLASAVCSHIVARTARSDRDTRLPWYPKYFQATCVAMRASLTNANKYERPLL